MKGYGFPCFPGMWRTAPTSIWLNPKQFLNVSTCSWCRGFATIIWLRRTNTFEMFLNFQKRPKRFWGQHTFYRKTHWFARPRWTWAILVPQLYWKASLVVVQSRLASLSSLFAAVVSKIKQNRKLGPNRQNGQVSFNSFKHDFLIEIFWCALKLVTSRYMCDICVITDHLWNNMEFSHLLCLYYCTCTCITVEYICITRH